jgi:hypothetical protein
MLPATQPFPPPLAEDWSALKDAVRRFEHAWRQAPRPGIDDYLPAGGPLRFRVLIELVHIDLELRLKAGESARVEEYLARYPELTDDRAVTLDLIAAEYELRRRREPGLSAHDYLQRFPLFRAELPGQKRLQRRQGPTAIADAYDHVVTLRDGPRRRSPVLADGMQAPGRWWPLTPYYPRGRISRQVKIRRNLKDVGRRLKRDPLRR